MRRIGFRNEPKFTNDAAAMMVLRDTISVMLLTHPFYATFTRKPIADAHNSSQVLLCISCDSPRRSTGSPNAAAAAGGKDRSVAPKQDMAVDVRPQLRGSRRPHWEPMWMDPEFAEKGAHPVEEATARNVAN